jgi:hypothetical protein
MDAFMVVVKAINNNSNTFPPKMFPSPFLIFSLTIEKVA